MKVLAKLKEGGAEVKKHTRRISSTDVTRTVRQRPRKRSSGKNKKEKT